MKTKAKKELHIKTIPELKARFSELKNEIFQLKMDKAGKKLKNLRTIFERRKEIARILTILEEKKLEATFEK